MGKIQEALKQLRKEGESGVAGARGGNARPLEIGESGAVDGTGGDAGRPRRYRAVRRYALPEGLEPEKAPKARIAVNQDDLLAGGLRPQDEHLEELGQLLRRIKRPVLNIAFGELGAETENSNVIMVSSALPKSGKSFCSVNLALSIARERDIGAVVVDADVLKPNISRAFGVDNRVGLIDYLLDRQLSLEDILVGTDMHDIVIVPAGQRHEEATELLASRRMEEFVHDMSVRFQARAIVVDTPPLMLTNEAHVLAEHMGQIVFVIESGATSVQSVSDALQSLSRDKPINAIVNKARGSAAGGYGVGYGGGYYGYYSTRES